jgi:hypothetical protein
VKKPAELAFAGRFHNRLVEHFARLRGEKAGVVDVSLDAARHRFNSVLCSPLTGKACIVTRAWPADASISLIISRISLIAAGVFYRFLIVA